MHALRSVWMFQNGPTRRPLPITGKFHPRALYWETAGTNITCAIMVGTPSALHQRHITRARRALRCREVALLVNQPAAERTRLDDDYHNGIAQRTAAGPGPLRHWPRSQK